LTSTPIAKAITSGAAGYLAAWAINKYLNSKVVADAVVFGSMMEAGSILISAYVPGASSFALSGLGDFVPADFNIPGNPISRGALSPVGGSVVAGSKTVPAVQTAGMGRAFAPAF
jgi:hypothetical protein